MKIRNPEQPANRAAIRLLVRRLLGKKNRTKERERMQLGGSQSRREVAETERLGGLPSERTPNLEQLQRITPMVKRKPWGREEEK